jgi:hypothetical protein
MVRSSKKLPLLLLALLMVFSPLQSAFAGVDFHLPVEEGQPGIHHPDMGGMSMHDEHGMNADCQHCDEQTGCNGHDCSHSHCASCVPGLLCVIKLTVTSTGSDSYAVSEPVHSSCLTSHPYRPPKV